MAVYDVQVVKIGIVENIERLEAIVNWVEGLFAGCRIIWDPILKASAGFSFHSALKLDIRLLKRLYLITPNREEYELLGLDRFRELPVLLKGGHRVITSYSIHYTKLYDIPVIFSIFPPTRRIAETLFGYLVSPLKVIAKSVLGYIPELMTIVVIVVITRYVLKFLRFVASELEAGKINLPGVITSYSIHYTKLYELRSHALVGQCQGVPQFGQVGVLVIGVS